MSKAINDVVMLADFLADNALKERFSLVMWVTEEEMSRAYEWQSNRKLRRWMRRALKIWMAEGLIEEKMTTTKRAYRLTEKGRNRFM